MSENAASTIHAAADDLNRGIAMVNTCLLALDSAQDDDDAERIRDTLYEAKQKLTSAERALGVYQPLADRKRP